MDISVGEKINVEGTNYNVIGKIRYRNNVDGCQWIEYRLKGIQMNVERWLSYDETYFEYSITDFSNNVNTNGYHIVDEGEEEVIGVWGKVDVKVGDKARFREYEDSTEEKIISSEVWDDGEEITSGYYVEPEDIKRGVVNEDSVPHIASYDGGSNSIRGTNNNNNSRKKWPLVLLVLFCGLFVFIEISSLGILDGGSSASSKTIEEVMDESATFTYETSITGNQNEKAKVYKANTDLDNAVKIILSGIEGNTESVQQNTEDGDNSVAILTKSEYCLVYTSEDNTTLAQVSSRKYAYTTDSRPYHSRPYTHRYFRRFYYSRGYKKDSSSYSGSATPYSSFGDTAIMASGSDKYNSYSSSVRQSSINHRTSSGGGLSSGK